MNLLKEKRIVQSQNGGSGQARERAPALKNKEAEELELE